MRKELVIKPALQFLAFVLLAWGLKSCLQPVLLVVLPPIQDAGITSADPNQIRAYLISFAAGTILSFLMCSVLVSLYQSKPYWKVFLEFLCGIVFWVGGFFACEEIGLAAMAGFAPWIFCTLAGMMGMILGNFLLWHKTSRAGKAI